MTHACWLHWVKAMKNCLSSSKPRRYTYPNFEWFAVCVIHSQTLIYNHDIFCFCSVLLEGILCRRCRKNGSTQTGKVSYCNPVLTLRWTEEVHQLTDFMFCVDVLNEALFFSTKKAKSEMFFFNRLHEQLNECDDAAQCYMLYIQDIFSCGVKILTHNAPVLSVLLYF